MIVCSMLECTQPSWPSWVRQNKIPQNSLPAVLLHMAGAFFIIPHTNTLYHIFLPCFLNITSSITHGRCILHNSTICCGILWNCIFIVVLYGCSSKFHNCGTLWNEPVFCKTALIVGGLRDYCLLISSGKAIDVPDCSSCFGGITTVILDEILASDDKQLI